jgi:rRNA maturation RNase YbeY
MSSPEGSTVTFRRLPADVRPRALGMFARRLEREVARGREFHCLIAGDAELRRLNRDFRGQDYATDVLAFPAQPLPNGRGSETRRVATPRPPLVGQAFSLPGQAKAPAPPLHSRSPFNQALAGGTAEPRPQGSGPGPLGDLAISLQRARAQARQFGHATETEIRVLMLHGLLHLLGLDHESDNGRMAKAERRWRTKLGLPGGLIERVRA